jgi:hypothetical protein
MFYWNFWPVVYLASDHHHHHSSDTAAAAPAAATECIGQQQPVLSRRVGRMRRAQRGRRHAKRDATLQVEACTDELVRPKDLWQRP